MNEIEELESLLNDLISGIVNTIQSGEVLSDEFQGQLANELVLLSDRIDLLKTQGVQDAIPPLTKSMPSSNISSFAYDPKNKRMFVRFLGKKPNRNGPIYSYDGVPKEIFNIFKKGAVPAKTDGKNAWGEWWKGKNPSMGASMNVLLKQAGFPYAKLT